MHLFLFFQLFSIFQVFFSGHVTFKKIIKHFLKGGLMVKCSRGLRRWLGRDAESRGECLFGWGLCDSLHGQWKEWGWYKAKKDVLEAILIREDEGWGRVGQQLERRERHLIWAREKKATTGDFGDILEGSGGNFYLETFILVWKLGVSVNWGPRCRSVIRDLREANVWMSHCVQWEIK